MTNHIYSLTVLIDGVRPNHFSVVVCIIWFIIAHVVRSLVFDPVY